MNEPISRAEHEEFVKRMEEEDRRQNKRIDLLEENVRQIGALTISVEKMACSIENMVKEQKEQGNRLAMLEEVPARKWKKSTEAFFIAMISALGTAVAAGMIWMLSNYM